MEKRLIVTHHAPDLDAIGAVWLLKRFNSEDYASASVSFVDPGDKISPRECENLGFSEEQVTHVDTGLGEFDHHQPERARQLITATSLVYQHLCQLQPELETDQALRTIIEYVIEIDHFKEISWPDAGSVRYRFMIHELIRGVEYTDPHNDEFQLRFGLTCLDNVYAVLKHHHKAEKILKEKGQTYQVSGFRLLAIETRNDNTIKLALTQGYDMVVCKDPQRGHIRIKARPDSAVELQPLYQKIIELDQKGTWLYHNSGKMLLNGSYKHRNQVPSPLTINQVVEQIKLVYG
ncbi:MAG TPA: DHH family phosphoesterase [Candidatus Woesebacteria bacterium]|nr:DHH family phosphoesterase [Candidatus Woesebacteria bacterium]